MTGGAAAKRIERARQPRTSAASVAAVALAFLLGGCGGDPIVAPAHAIRPMMPTVHLLATVSVENGCPLLDDGTGRILPIWPEGATVGSETLRMREAPISRLGEAIRVGGRWLIPDEVGKELLAPLPAGCAGTGRVFWVQTFEFAAPEGPPGQTP